MGRKEMNHELIAAQTGAVSAKAKFNVTKDRIPVTIYANGLAGAEEVDLWMSHDGGTTWEELELEGSAVVLTATDKAKTFYGPMTIAVTKDATVAATGVFATSEENNP